ncbi:claudin-4-like [Anabas testudineus]|uniref:claudin-4-like n=1 Tax=Anabas testudineus TaxID=64144 RepID=UPI000E45A4D5|nr:claudin-4-like [Anabas testudineus]
MVSDRSQIVGLALAIIGLLGTIITCGLPMWKVERFTGIVGSGILWEGLWMACVRDFTQKIRCKVYNSDQILSPDLLAARALVSLAIIFGLFGILLGIAGGKCTNFIQVEHQRCKVTIAAGVSFIISGVLVLIPISLTANTIIRDINNPLVFGIQKREMGPSLYVGWAAAGLLLMGGGLLCIFKKNKLSASVRFSSLKNQCAA